MAVKRIKPVRYQDHRGWFSETYVEGRWRELGVDADFVQDNMSYSAQPGTIRGIHFQSPPFAQAKLVTCIRGRVMDFAVDLRSGSPTYGRSICAELSALNGHQLYLPVGFGHAFVTIEADCELLYKVSNYYAPACDGGIRWDCPDLAIDWPLGGGAPVISEKDRSLPALAEIVSPFAYDGVPLELADV
jgi:dTDP-4-dehydrorhamnose 3,5-epimerase